MSQPLRYSGFKWKERKDGKFHYEKGKGYILEVDLEYPKHLHKSHNDYPHAQEILAVKEEWLSEYQTERLEYDKHNKTLSRISWTRKNVVHYRNLLLYLSLGMKLKVSTAFRSLMKNHGWNYISASTQNCAKKPSLHSKKIFTN